MPNLNNNIDPMKDSIKPISYADIFNRSNKLKKKNSESMSHSAFMRRLHMNARQMAECWSGVHRFERTHDARVAQVDKLPCIANKRRLVAVVNSTSGAAWDKVYDCVYGENREHVNLWRGLYWRRLCSLQNALGVLQNNMITDFMAAHDRRHKLDARAIQEVSLVSVTVGMSHPVFDLIWEHYPRHGVPIGIRRNGTLLLLVGDLTPYLQAPPRQHTPKTR